MTKIIRKKRNLLIASWIFGMSFNLCLLYLEKMWDKLWPTSFLILEVATLGYGISLIITIVDLFFKDHRNFRVIFLNTFFILLTVSIIWVRSHVLQRTTPFKVIFQDTPAQVEALQATDYTVVQKL